MNQTEFNLYYSNKEVMFEIIKCLKNKEVALFGDKFVRCIIADNKYYLDSNFKRFDFNKTINNVYYSLANYDWNKMRKELGFSCFSFEPNKRKEQMTKFNETSDKFIKSYDLGIDFDNHDGDNYTQVYEDCKKLKEYFDNYQIPYTLKTSGSGFHIEVKANNLPKSIKETTDINEQVKKIGILMADIKLILDLETMDIGDDGEFYEPRRVFKVPYTLDYKTGVVALPLNDYEFNSVSTKERLAAYCSIKTVSLMNLFNRGLLERHGSDEGFDNFVKEVIN